MDAILWKISRQYGIVQLLFHLTCQVVFVPTEEGARCVQNIQSTQYLLHKS